MNRQLLCVLLTIAVGLSACSNNNSSSDVGDTGDSTNGTNGTDNTDGSDGSDGTDGTDGSTVTDTTEESPSGAVVVLSPLPDPPLTEAPSADDEPVLFDNVFHTITQYSAFRDTGPREERVAVQEFTEDDFTKGLPEPVITVPSGVDTANNAPPFFTNLENVRIEAGQTLQLRFAPVDPDGGIPGMFPQRLPEGATWDDNFDTTRTLNWQPLQEDIGITSFTAVAIDSEVGAYRSAQTVLIAVDPSSDPASIPNVAPSIREVTPYTVRVGDPVSIFIIGIDRNGTDPTIELVNPPSGAILTSDARTPEWQILQVTPDTVGPLVIDILSRDAEDPSVTGLDQITLDVRSIADFERPGVRLRDVFAGSDRVFGSAISPVFYMQADGGVYEAFAGSEFGVMSPESSMKWSAINPLPGRFEFADMDTLMNFAEFYNMQVRGHTLVWHNNLPSWVESTESEDREIHMREFITRVMTRYADRVDYWDVVNEPISEDESGLRDNLWYEAMGETYIDIAFHQARELDPTATLVLNEFDIGFAGRKFDDLLALVDRLLDRQVPIDAIGFQMHIFSSFDQYDEFAANMAAFAARDLDVHITELDVALVNDDTEATQADVYERVAQTCLAETRCTVLQTWGFTDRYSFRRTLEPLYLDTDYQIKPAYTGLQNAPGSR